MNKRLAIALFFCYAILLTLVITFGSDIADGISKFIQTKINEAYITDVSVELEESYIIEKSFTPKYNAMGRFDDPLLSFEALDDTLTVNATTGSFKGKRTANDTTEGRIRITSGIDPEFEKIITVRFVKKYPENFNIKYITKSAGSGSYLQYVGLPTHFYLSTPSGQEYSEKSFELVYDPEYFELSGANTLTPIKETPEGKTVSVSMVFANGATAKTGELTIKKPDYSAHFDSIELKHISNGRDENTVGSKYTLILYKDGKRLFCDYKLSFKNKLASQNSYFQVVFNKIGREEITVTLPNGYSETITVDINNKLSLPTLKGAEFDKNGYITTYRYEDLTLDLSFPSNTTYKKFDVECTSPIIWISASSSSITIKNEGKGEGEFTLVFDDGAERIEKTYKVIVKPQTSISTLIKYNTRKFVAKVIGHTGGFAMLALFALNMFRYLRIKNKLLRFLAYSYSAFVFAFITEFIQYFIPSRTGRFRDMLIDMGGYYFGTLVILAVCAGITIYKKHKQRSKDNLKPNTDAASENT